METTLRPTLARPRLTIPFGIAALAIAAIPVAALFAQGAPAPFTVVETGQSYGKLQDAVSAIGGGTGSIAIAPGTYRDCAVQREGAISYLASEPGKVTFDGGICEGKAALVLRGRSAEISGLTFTNMHVREWNGAGIRIEKGDLTVTQSWFRDSDQGILSAQDPSSNIIVDKSTFTRLGTCNGGGGCAHSIYIGDFNALRVTRSRFEEGRGGHYVKTRTGQVQIASSSFDDSNGQATNYMIDLPAGARGQITNNWFVQGQNKENWSAFIAVGAEGVVHASNDLTIATNDARLAPGVQRNTIFVADWSGQVGNITNNNLGYGLSRYEVR